MPAPPQLCHLVEALAEALYDCCPDIQLKEVEQAVRAAMTRAALLRGLRRGLTRAEIASAHGVDRKTLARNSTLDEGALRQELTHHAHDLLLSRVYPMSAIEVERDLGCRRLLETARRCGITVSSVLAALAARGLVTEIPRGPRVGALYAAASDDVTWPTASVGEVLTEQRRAVSEMLTSALVSISEAQGADYAQAFAAHTDRVTAGVATPADYPRTQQARLLQFSADVPASTDVGTVVAAVRAAVIAALGEHEHAGDETTRRVRVSLAARGEEP